MNGRKRSAPWQAVLGFVLASIVLSLIGVAFHLHTQHAHRSLSEQAAIQQRVVPKEDVVHVAFCTDDTDLRGLLVAIKTALATSSNPSRLRFHVVTSSELAELIATLLQWHVKDVQLEVHHNIELQARITSMVPIRTSSLMLRQHLASPFNFAPFYLNDFLGGKVKKVLYLDTDVVLKADILDIFDVPLRDEAAAAVKDCLVRYEDIFNLVELSKMGLSNFDPRTCIYQRGVLLLDLELWKSGGFTQKIEEWLQRYRDAEDVLWWEGFSQSAWLLGMHGGIKDLDPRWNCFNLGKPTMSLEEGAAVRGMGLDHKALLFDLHIAINNKYGTMKPFLVTCYSSAKLLHFSGELKPWLANVWQQRTPAPVCFVPADLRIPTQTTGDFWTYTGERRQRLVRCMELWMQHLTKEEDCSLKDTEKEWVDDEQMWHDTWKREQKLKLTQKEEEKRSKEEQDNEKKEKGGTEEKEHMNEAKTEEDGARGGDDNGEEEDEDDGVPLPPNVVAAPDGEPGKEGDKDTREGEDVFA